MSPAYDFRGQVALVTGASSGLAAMSRSACGGKADDGAPAGASDGTPIRITFGDTELTARLHERTE